MLVFAAADQQSVGNLLAEARRYLAWKSIVSEAVAMHLDRAQERLASETADQADRTVQAQLDDAYKWAFAPQQEGTEALKWEALTLSGGLGSTGSLPVRTSHKLQTDELLITRWSPTHLRTALDKYLWKDGQPHISVKALWDYFGTYCYLDRLRDRDVLLETIKSGVMSTDFFGYATNVTEDGRYEGLSFGRAAPGIYFDESSVVVRAEVAAAAVKETATLKETDDGPDVGVISEKPKPSEPAVAAPPKRFYGTIRLNPQRLAGSAGQVGEEVLQHLAGLVDADVDVVMEITVKVRDGIPKRVVRTVSENATTLKFDEFAFEQE